jgi:hypothetical protein
VPAPVSASFEPHQPLLVALAAHGQNQDTARRKLLGDLRRDLFGGGGHQDAIEWRLLGPAETAIAMARGDVVDAQILAAPFGFEEQALCRSMV